MISVAKALIDIDVRCPVWDLTTVSFLKNLDMPNWDDILNVKVITISIMKFIGSRLSLAMLKFVNDGGEHEWVHEKKIIIKYPRIPSGYWLDSYHRFLDMMYGYSKCTSTL